MSHSLIVSDLHLCATRPRITQCFLKFLDQDARHAAALYILGDLFEVWIGDDDSGTPPHDTVAAALAQVAEAGTSIFFMHGNRDFLLGEAYSAQARMTLLPDPWVADLHGQRVLLLHGDTLCTDDPAYQSFRAQVRTESWKQAFLARPLAERSAEADRLRGASEAAKREKAMASMDATESAIQAAFLEIDCTQMVHGHTHRPACHRHTVAGRECVRWVLPDWHSQGGGLRVNADGIDSVSIGFP